MKTSEFALYGYQIDNSMNRLTGAAIGSLFIAIPCALSLSPLFLLLLFIPLGIFIYFKRSGCSKPLLIASRYLILGDLIIYYRNVSGVTLDKKQQTLTLNATRGKSITIAADKFPTNARKLDKIRHNKTAKFEKVSAKIIAMLKANAPDVVIS
jgi:hypothetical protein